MHACANVTPFKQATKRTKQTNNHTKQEWVLVLVLCVCVAVSLADSLVELRYLADCRGGLLGMLRVLVGR
jgi:hypothetical protein